MNINSSDLLESVDLCAKLYTDSTGWVKYYTKDSVIAAHLKLTDGSDCITFRGTANFKEWLIDFRAMPTLDKTIGWCESGFLSDMEDVTQEILSDLVVPYNLKVTGHSLGGARARIFTGKCITRGIPVSLCITYGSPKPAFSRLANLFTSNTNLAYHCSFRNGVDIVPTTPATIPLLEYVHTEEYVSIGDESTQFNDTFLAHKIDNYQKAIRKFVQI